MKYSIPGVLTAVLFAGALSSPGLAQTGSSKPDRLVVAQASSESAASGRSRKRSEKKAKREPTANQMAARERQKKCAGEWKSAKAAGTVATGMRWPKFWSACNSRLKGNSA